MKESAAISPFGSHSISPKVITVNSLFSDSLPKAIICVRAHVSTWRHIIYITNCRHKGAKVSKVRSADNQHKAQLPQKHLVCLWTIIDPSRCDLVGLGRPRSSHFIKHLQWSNSVEGSWLLKDLLKFKVVEVLPPIPSHYGIGGTLSQLWVKQHISGLSPCAPWPYQPAFLLFHSLRHSFLFYVFYRIGWNYGFIVIEMAVDCR